MTASAYWLESVPIDWGVVAARRVLRIRREIPGPNRADDYLRSSLTMKGVLPRSRDANEGLQPASFDAYQLHHPGDLVFKLIDLSNITTSRVGLANFTGLVSPAYIVAIPRPTLDPAFAFYYFLDLYNQRILNSIGGDGVRSSLSPRDLMAIPVPMPPLAQQRAIADFLDRETAKVDVLVEKQLELVNRLGERKNSALIALADASREGVSEVRAGTLLTKLGLQPQAGSPIVTAFRDGKVIDRNLRRTEGYTFSAEESGYQGVRRGDLVFHALDGFAGAVGISETSGQCTPVYHVCEVHGADPIYVALTLRALGLSGLLTAFAWSVRERSADYRNWSLFASLRLPLLPLEEQRRAARMLASGAQSIDSIIFKTERHIALARERRNALITAAVTGQLEIPAA